ncbi:MAG TPA: cell surface protein SprA, partial [Gemmatimonadaceae bacterium]|nr:cell surface protein SprA [Gemmatimonadaceae bacterium]
MRSTPSLAAHAAGACAAGSAPTCPPAGAAASRLAWRLLATGAALALAAGALPAQDRRPPVASPPTARDTVRPQPRDTVRDTTRATPLVPTAEGQQLAPPPSGLFLRYPPRRDTTLFRFNPGTGFSPFGQFTFASEVSAAGGVEGLAAARAARLQQLTQARVQALWGQTATASLTPGAAAPADATFASRDVRDRQRGTQPPPAGVPTPLPPPAAAPNAAAAGVAPPRAVPPTPATPPDTGDAAIIAALQREVTDSIARVRGKARDTTGTGLLSGAARDSAAKAGGLLNGPVDLFGDYADLNLDLNARLETKLERSRNERCTSNLYFVSGANCRGGIQPNFDFQFNVRTGGVVADRVHVNVDYDSQREFDASNNISVYYEGKSDELIQRLEVGNVSFVPPPSRFITAGIPSGNYGVQAIGQLGPMRFRTIVAQQKGNVVKDRVFTVGDRSLQNVTLDLEDYKIEARRFFFTVDPRRFGGYPSIDILNPQAMAAAAAQLPDSARPTKVYIYRLRFGEQPVNPNGPQFIVRGSRNGQNRGPVYELLREGVDYYVDPSQLWFALVRPLSLNAERLVVAYNVHYAGGDRSVAGGTPDLQFTQAPQYANLIYDPLVVPGDTAFFQEIRSVYRFGGEDIQRQTVAVKVVTGSSGDQEKPVAGGFDTYLQMLQLSQANNSSTFDIDNHLWPRPSDPNYTSGGGGGKLIKDNFLVFPSLRPFATRDSGLVSAGNVANDTIYKTPSEDLFSQRHPQSVYHIRAKYEAAGGGDAGSLALGSVQVSRNSERILIGGVPLKRDVDYTVDYELGRVTFLRPDTLFASPRQVTVQYEENPLFAAAPTAIFGIASQFPLTNGSVNFTAISQSQKTTFNRPPLGFEPASSLVAGVSGNFTFEADALSRALQRLPFSQSTAPSRVDVSGEFATSRPQPNAAGQAYVESFEGEGGTTVTLSDPAWYYSSQPADGHLATQVPGLVLDSTHAATMAWQNNGVDDRNSPVLLNINQIDPLVNITGQGLQQAEQILWLTLYPLNIGGLRVPGSDAKFDWLVPNAPTGRRWRSIRTSFGATGSDLSRVEQLEFWSFVDTSEVGRRANPTVVFDFGEISENSLTFSPTKLCVGCDAAKAVGVDSLYTGKQAAGLDTMNTERNPLSRGFNVGTDDIGLPGDRVPSLAITTPGGATVDTSNFATCQGGSTTLQRLGDARANCTVLNSRLDEEDLDLDAQLNLRQAQRNDENLLRYVVDMSKDSTYNRVGQCYNYATGLGAPNKVRCWVLFRVPFRVPTDSINNPNRRRVNGLRLTVVSGEAQPDDQFTEVPLARLRLVGSPWLKRSERAVQGIGGEAPGLANSYVVAGIIGTQDSTATLVYDSPPGVTDAPDQKQTGLETNRVQINERSMRLTAGNLRRYDRAEAYYRFPEGQRNFMGYRTLRVWAKGRGNGWGDAGELNFYLKIGRDADNFYVYRTPVQAGRGKAAWTD